MGQRRCALHELCVPVGEITCLDTEKSSSTIHKHIEQNKRANIQGRRPSYTTLGLRSEPEQLLVRIDRERI